MDLMPVHTAQSPEFIASAHDANARKMAAHQQAAGARAAPPDLLSTDNPEVLRQYLNGTQTRHKDAFPLGNNLTIFHHPECIVRSAERKTDVFEKHLARELHLPDDEDTVFS